KPISHGMELWNEVSCASVVLPEMIVVERPTKMYAQRRYACTRNPCSANSHDAAFMWVGTGLRFKSLSRRTSDEGVVLPILRIAQSTTNIYCVGGTDETS